MNLQRKKMEWMGRIPQQGEATEMYDDGRLAKGPNGGYHPFRNFSKCFPCLARQNPGERAEAVAQHQVQQRKS